MPRSNHETKPQQGVLRGIQMGTGWISMEVRLPTDPVVCGPAILNDPRSFPATQFRRAVHRAGGDGSERARRTRFTPPPLVLQVATPLLERALLRCLQFRALETTFPIGPARGPKERRHSHVQHQPPSADAVWRHVWLLQDGFKAAHVCAAFRQPFCALAALPQVFTLSLPQGYINAFKAKFSSISLSSPHPPISARCLASDYLNKFII